MDLARAAPTLAFAAALLLGGATARAADPAPGWDLPQLMQSLQQVRAATADFVERKYMHMLKEPLQSSGKLVYVAPDKLQKDTVQPKPERLIVVGDQLTIERPGDKPRELSLGDYPQIWAFIESIRATLAGDLPTLSRFYQVSLEGGAADWTMTLVPRERKMRDLVGRIRIGGEHDKIRRIETAEGEGDRTEMQITAEAR